MRKIFLFFLPLLILAVSLCLSLSAYAEEGDAETPSPETPVSADEDSASDGISPFDLYVGGVAVMNVGEEIKTEDPEDTTRVLTAVYQNKDGKQKLILSGHGDLAGGDTHFSVLYTGEDALSVEIALGSNVTFAQPIELSAGSLSAVGSNVVFKRNVKITDGSINLSESFVDFDSGIWIGRGSFSAEKNSTVNFKGIESGNSAFLRVADGTISFADCTIVVAPGSGISVVDPLINEFQTPAGTCFAAGKITLDSATMTVPYSDRSEPLHAVLWGSHEVEIKSGSVVRLNGTGYFSDAFAYAGERLLLSDSGLNVSGVGCILNLPEADLTMTKESEINGNAICGMYLGGDAMINSDSRINILSGRCGIAVVGKAANFHADRSDIHLSNTDTSLVAPAGRTRPWDEGAIVSAAFYAKNSSANFKNCKFTASNYPIGMLVISGSRFDFTGYLNLSAKKAAFLAIVAEKENVNFGSRISGSATLFTLQVSDAFGDMGKYAVALTPYDGAFKQSANAAIQTPDDVVNAFTGYITNCILTIESFPAVIIIVPCVVLIAATVLVIVLYQSGVIMHGKHKNRTEDTTAESALPAENIEENTTDTNRAEEVCIDTHDKTQEGEM